MYCHDALSKIRRSIFGTLFLARDASATACDTIAVSHRRKPRFFGDLPHFAPPFTGDFVRQNATPCDRTRQSEAEGQPPAAYCPLPTTTFQLPKIGVTGPSRGINLAANSARLPLRFLHCNYFASKVNIKNIHNATISEKGGRHNHENRYDRPPRLTQEPGRSWDDPNHPSHLSSLIPLEIHHPTKSLVGVRKGVRVEWHCRIVVSAQSGLGGNEPVL